MLFLLLNLCLVLFIIRPQDFMVSLYGTPLVFIVMSGLGFAWIFSQLEKKVETNIDMFFMAFFLVVVLSGVLTFDFSYAIDNIVETLKIAIIYSCAVTIINTEKKLVSSFWFLTSLISVVAFMAILQKYGYDIAGTGMYWASDKQVWQIRGVGIFDNPNDLAYSVLPASALSLSTLLLDKRLFVRAISFLVMTLTFYCVYLTNSRGGYLALGVLIIVVLNYCITNIAYKKVFVLVVFCCFIGVFFSISDSYRGDESSMGRVEAWSYGMEMLSENPLFGVGKGMFTDNYVRGSHNSYVRAGAELGFVGFYVFMGILCWCVMSLKFISTSSELSRYKIYSIALISYVFSFMVGSLFSTRTYSILFVIIASFISALVRIINNNSEFSKQNRLLIDMFWNSKIFFISVASIVIWKVFLIQTW